MKNLLLFTALSGSLVMVGCSSAYRTSQTPDDVYFSEGPPAREYAERKQVDETPQEGYTSYWEKQDDNMLRMKVSDRDRWNSVDDIDYWQGYNNNYWVNYNSPFNSPWAYNPYAYNPHSFNNPWAFSNPWSFNNPWNWNRGFNNSFGMGMGWNSWGMGLNSWNNNWSNPYAWNQPVKVINRYPVGASSRSATALTPYSNYSYNRGANTMKNRMVVNPGTSRSVFEGSNYSTTDRSGNSMYRTINRSGVNTGNSGSYERPTRTFDSGNSNSGGTRSSGSSSGSSSGGTSSGSGGSRGGRGG